jgi:hypothetical protein
MYLQVSIRVLLTSIAQTRIVSATFQIFPNCYERGHHRHGVSRGRGSRKDNRQGRSDLMVMISMKIGDP